jgi:WD40 repeat protein
VDLHPSGKLAASGADDGAIRVYSTLGSGELLCTLSAVVRIHRTAFLLFSLQK